MKKTIKVQIELQKNRKVLKQKRIQKRIEQNKINREEIIEKKLSLKEIERKQKRNVIQKENKLCILEN